MPLPYANFTGVRKFRHSKNGHPGRGVPTASDVGEAFRFPRDGKPVPYKYLFLQLFPKPGQLGLKFCAEGGSLGGTVDDPFYKPGS